MSQSKTRLLELNARLAQNLTGKGVEATADETSTALVNKVIDIPSPKEEQEKSINITENGIVEILPDENKSLSKVTVNVDVDSNNSFYDAFWNVYQQNGKKADYSTAFADGKFTIENFKPKYDIKPTHAQSIFAGFPNECDLRKLLADSGVVLDFSKSTGSYCFMRSKFTALPVIDRSMGYDIYHWFANCTSLHTIEKLIIAKGIAAANLNAFNNCTSLKNIIIEGEIGASFDIKWSPLTAESAKSIITHLVNYTGTENEFDYSVYFSETTWGYLDAEGETASPNGNSWRDYVYDLGWNI